VPFGRRDGERDYIIQLCFNVDISEVIFGDFNGLGGAIQKKDPNDDSPTVFTSSDIQSVVTLITPGRVFSGHD